MMRSATAEDAAFVAEMARHACVISDRPLPDADSEEVRSLLPRSGDVVVVAVGREGRRLGAVWTLHHEPPLFTAAVPELAIAVMPDVRGAGVGGALLDELIARCEGLCEALCLNVHVRNPAAHLYERKGFRVTGQGRGPLGVAMRMELH